MKWLGGSETWEPEEHLADAKESVEERFRGQKPRETLKRESSNTIATIPKDWWLAKRG